MIVPMGDVSNTSLFMICGIIYCIAILPATLSKAASPSPCRRSSWIYPPYIATRRSPSSAS